MQVKGTVHEAVSPVYIMEAERNHCVTAHNAAAMTHTTHWHCVNQRANDVYILWLAARFPLWSGVVTPIPAFLAGRSFVRPRHRELGRRSSRCFAKHFTALRPSCY